MSDKFFYGIDEYLTLDETKEIDREKLCLKGQFLSITFKSFNGKKEFNEIIKTDINHFTRIIEFNERGDIIQTMEFDLNNDISYNSIFDYDEKNNLINIYKGFGKYADLSKDFLFSSYSYDEDNNLSNEFAYRPKDRNIHATEKERYVSKSWSYEKSLVIEEKSSSGKIKYEYNSEGHVIQKEEEVTTYDGIYAKTTSKYFYNSKNQLIKVILQQISRGVSDSITTYSYDENDNLTEKKIIKPSTPPRKYIDASYQYHDKEITYIFKAEPETLIYHELNEFDVNSNLISQTIYKNYEDAFKQLNFIYENNLLVEKIEKNELGEKIKVTIIEYSITKKILQEKTYSEIKCLSVKKYEYDEYDNLIKIVFIEDEEIRYIKEIIIE